MRPKKSVFEIVVIGQNCSYLRDIGTSGQKSQSVEKNNTSFGPPTSNAQCVSGTQKHPVAVKDIDHGRVLVSRA